MTADQGRVRLRWSRGSYITAVMPWPEAGQLQDDLLTDVVRKGDGTGFVDFTGHDGREVSVRARDVVAVECLPELPARVQPPVVDDRGADGGAHGVVVTVTSSAGAAPVTPATAFLRQHAGIPVHGASSGGGR